MHACMCSQASHSQDMLFRDSSYFVPVSKICVLMTEIENTPELSNRMQFYGIFPYQSLTPHYHTNSVDRYNMSKYVIP